MWDIQERDFGCMCNHWDAGTEILLILYCPEYPSKLNNRAHNFSIIMSFFRYSLLDACTLETRRPSKSNIKYKLNLYEPIFIYILLLHCSIFSLTLYCSFALQVCWTNTMPFIRLLICGHVWIHTDNTNTFHDNDCFKRLILSKIKNKNSECCHPLTLTRGPERRSSLRQDFCQTVL